MGRTIRLLAIAIVFAWGCDGVNTGIGAPGEPTPGDTDPQDPTPAPTQEPNDPGDDILPPLTELGGFFVVNRNRGSTDFVIEDNFEGAGWFFPSAQYIPPGLFDDFFDYGANWPDDTCRPGSAMAISGPLQVLDAGTLTLHGPTGDLPFFTMFGIYAAADGDPNLFQPLDTYELEATGAQISAFTVQIGSPGDIEVSSPMLLSSDPFPIDRTVDLQLKWSSNDDGKPVFVMVKQGAGNSYHCKFVDDGSAAIPASVLQNFPPTGYVEDNEIPELQVWKYKYTYFQPPGAPAPILFVIEAGWYIEATFL